MKPEEIQLLGSSLELVPGLFIYILLQQNPASWVAMFKLDLALKNVIHYKL